MSGIDCFGFCFASPDGWEPESLLAAGGNCGFTCEAASRCLSITVLIDHLQINLFRCPDAVTTPRAADMLRLTLWTTRQLNISGSLVPCSPALHRPPNRDEE